VYLLCLRYVFVYFDSYLCMYLGCVPSLFMLCVLHCMCFVVSVVMYVCMYVFIELVRLCVFIYGCLLCIDFLCVSYVFLSYVMYFCSSLCIPLVSSSFSDVVMYACLVR